MQTIIGAVDATFFQYMMLVSMDLPSGSLLMEEVAEDHTYTTWKAWVDPRLEALSLVSEQAKPLMQLAHQGLGCLRSPDCFPLVHDLSTS